MHELWELMETPVDERGRFGHFSSLLSQAADDALEKGCLGLDILREVMRSYFFLSYIYSSILLYMSNSEYQTFYQV